MGAEDLPDIDVDQVRQQLDEIRASLEPLITDGGGLGLKEVAVELGVTMTGKVGFIVAGAEAEASATITLTFARPELSDG